MAIPSETYDRDYFLSDRCEGWERFREDRGLSALKRREVELIGPAPGARVLDAGCGRGEVLLACAKAGARVTGIDYSRDAVEISRETLAAVPSARVLQADVTALPFRDASFDRALLGDVIEHLDAVQVTAAIEELRRVLAPGGRLVVHTAPNRLFLRFAWPALRPLLLTPGARRARARLDAWIAESKRYHVEEQSAGSLRRSLRAAGFDPVRVWVDPQVLRGGDHHLTKELASSPPARALARLAGRRPLRDLLGNDVYAVAVSPGA